MSDIRTGIIGFLARAKAEIERLRAENAKLRAALADCPCPRPANAAPDDTTIGQCIGRDECGCCFGETLNHDVEG